MRIAIGADHAGFSLKQHLLATLARLGHEVNDRGTHSEQAIDYPPICVAVGRAVTDGRAERGIVLGGSGQGEQIAANKVRGIRAALVWSVATAELAREHNDANVIAIGARQHTFEEAASFIDLFIATPFSGEARHSRRIAQIAAFEDDGSLEPDPRASVGQPDVLAADDSSFDPEAG